LTDLRRKSPKYIVTIRPLDTFEQFSDIYSFIRNHYLLEKKLQDDRFLYVDRKYEAGKI